MNIAKFTLIVIAIINILMIIGIAIHIQSILDIVLCILGILIVYDILNTLIKEGKNKHE